jgi:hypothetical protein
MRAPSVRVVLAGLTAAVVFVGGSIATRNGPLGGGGDDVEAGRTTPDAAGATAQTTSSTGLGTLSERLARLPSIAPGELAGVLEVRTGECSPATIDLGTLEMSARRADVCAAPGARFGVRLLDIEADRRNIAVFDLDGRPIETVAVPAGWLFYHFARRGIVLCDDEGRQGRLRRFRGGTTRLPSCPLGETRDGLLLFPGAHRRSVIDERGRRIVALSRPLQQFPTIHELGDRLLAVDADLYRDGRRIASDGGGAHFVFGASRDGKVALLEGDGTMFLYRDGVLHPIDDALVAGSDVPAGVVAPDGRRILLQSDNETLLEIDAATRRPLARLELGARGYLSDWRPATGAPGS